jgi:hypothetical protein
MTLRSVRRVRASLLLLVFTENLENPTTAVSDVLSADTPKHSLMTTIFSGAKSGRSRTPARNVPVKIPPRRGWPIPASPRLGGVGRFRPRLGSYLALDRRNYPAAAVIFGDGSAACV